MITDLPFPLFRRTRRACRLRKVVHITQEEKMVPISTQIV